MSSMDKRHSVTFLSEKQVIDAPEYEMVSPPSSSAEDGSFQFSDITTTTKTTAPTTNNTIIEEAQECLAQALLMFLYADLRLLSATGRINTKFETLCIDSDKVRRTTAADMAQLGKKSTAHLPQDDSMNSTDSGGEGISPGQVMAILFVELRQEVLAQRRRAKETLKRDRGLFPNLISDDDEDELGEEPDDEDFDAGIMNKITDRKGRKEFETDMHTLIRSYNDMLAQDLKGIPEVKLERFINPLRRSTLGNTRKNKNRQWPTLSQMRLFSFDEVELEQEQQQQNASDHDEEGSRGSKNSKSSATGRSKLAAKFQSLRKKTPSPPPDYCTIDSETQPVSIPPTRAFCDSTVRSSLASRPPPLSLIEESKSEDGTDKEISESEKGTEVDFSESDNVQKLSAATTTTSEGTNTTPGKNNPPLNAPVKLNQSKLFDSIMSMRGMKAQHPRDIDLQSDPGPTQSHSWVYGESPRFISGIGSSEKQRPGLYKRPSLALTQQLNQLKQAATDTVERYKEDHAMYNKLFIPTDDYETFAGAENVGDKMVRLRSSINMPYNAMGAVPESSTFSDPGRDMSENELLDFMTKCIESRNVDSLDFMTDFFRDDTISQTMVKSNAQVVWLQDWYPIKDCIYAISVDKKKKRVLVVFRGATTRADWNHGFDAAMKRGHNPVPDTYDGKKSYIKIHRGFYTYLFRTRKDTSTRKFDEIANKVYEYGNKMIGKNDFTVTVNGYSLGGALSVLFGFYASTDERFTKNGPVKIFSYGMPYAVSHTFADAFRHQERNKKVQHARFYNSNDIVAHLPFNLKPTRRGSNFVHVGIDVKLYGTLRGSRYPRFYYNNRQSPGAAYWRAIKLNCFFNMPFPWQIKNKHGLPELQKRIKRASLVADMAKKKKKKKNRFLLFRSTLDEAYEAMLYKTDV